MTHFNEMNPSSENLAAATAWRRENFPGITEPKPLTDPIITLMDDDTWKLDWRSESDTTPVNRVVLESLFRAHNDYVQAHGRRLTVNEAQYVHRDGSVSTERPVTAAGRLLAQLNVLEGRMDALESQNATLTTRLDAVESRETRLLPSRRVIICPSCNNTFGAPTNGDRICPYCRVVVG